MPMPLNSVLLATPEHPSHPAIWLDLDEDSMYAVCGRCDAWWFVQDDDPLEGVVVCAECYWKDRLARTRKLS